MKPLEATRFPPRSLTGALATQFTPTQPTHPNPPQRIPTQPDVPRPTPTLLTPTPAVQAGDASSTAVLLCCYSSAFARGHSSRVSRRWWLTVGGYGFGCQPRP